MPQPRRGLSALAIAMAIAMCVMDASIANVALPAIVTALEAPASQLVWVVNAYQLTILVSLLPLSALGEAVGFRRVYVAGLIVFIIGSAACAMAQDANALIAARVLQGLGAAGVMSINAALVRHTYPTRLLGRGVGLNALVVAASAAAGPTAAAGILSVAPWPWLFAVNIPMGLLTLALAVRALPAPRPSGRVFDWISAGLNALALAMIVLGMDRAAHGRGEGLMMIALGVGAGVILVRRARRQAAPLVPVDLLRSRPLALALGLVVAAFTAHSLALIGLPFLLHDLFGRTVVQVGLLMTAWPLATGLAAMVSGRLAGRVPSGVLGGVGMTLAAAGLLAWGLMPVQTGAAGLVTALAAAGAGFGLFQSPNTRDILMGAPHGRSGGASGLLASGRLAGQTLGAVLTGALFHLFGTGASRLVLAAAAAFALLAAAISLAKLIPRPHRR